MTLVTSLLLVTFGPSLRILPAPLPTSHRKGGRAAVNYLYAPTMNSYSANAASSMSAS